MPSAQERIREAVGAIQGWLAHLPNPGEAVVRQAIVLRLLHAAGFDIWNPAEVVPEETNATGNRSDFLIRVGEGKCALELKGMNVTLGAAHYQQAATYAVNEGTRWAIITNGRVWVALDEHLPGRWEDRVALKLELGQEGHTFADDLAALLDVETWRADAFADAVQTIKSRQQQRLDEARIRREKTAVVEGVMAQFKIPTFALAVAAALEMNKLTEAERDVLLGRPVALTRESPPASRQRKRHKPEVPPQRIQEESSGKIRFTYSIKEALAHAVYEPEKGTWTVLAGSTAIAEIKLYAGAVSKRRELGLAEGMLIQESSGLLRYVKDVEYPTPSQAADDISGASKNGWTVWKDTQGRTAQHYRPAKNRVSPAGSPSP
ncbi:DUF4357 domain-containing protein [Deinococcus koreensis]|uniref:DUF4357 domain-containing protein n=1 Tax=Deinococcus koreensis TaxID=2054903 RepID=A0A2K3UYS0_9DEIO|nr:DUF4357 domain-containing protein [Deinococcus koreensis]PNY81673.1 DUF4357 domain-containing protein [Deinococcus koreensis]